MTQNDNQRFLQTGFIKYYIPHRMWVALFAFLALIVWMRDDLYVRFMAHASLNALICGTAVIVIFMAFMNAFRVQWAANFLKNAETYEDSPSKDKLEALIKQLRGKAHFLDDFNLQQIILRFAQQNQSHLVFDDNVARIIKSKVGQRAGHLRNNVQYMAGVLVMLGLIGTFWGLLETITSVGEAMAAITETFSASSGGGSGNGMVEFLKSISKPLQGMGIAFSASLFGLSGSLLGGLLNNFASKGMDKFIAHFSVWIDSRIPKNIVKKADEINPVAIIEQHNATVVKALENVLATIGTQSKDMFSKISDLIISLSQFQEQQKTLIQHIGNDSRVNIRLADAMETAVVGLHNDNKVIQQAILSLPNIHNDIGNQLQQIHNLINNRIIGHIDGAVNYQNATTENLNRLIDAYTVMTRLQEQVIEGVYKQPVMQTSTPVTEQIKSLNDAIYSFNDGTENHKQING